MGRPRPSVRLEVNGDRRMPVARRVHQQPMAQRVFDGAVQHRHDALAVGHRQRAAAAEVELHVDDEQRRTNLGSHCSPFSSDWNPVTMSGVMLGGALSTDLYELTMMAGYYTAGMMAPAT